MPSLAVRPYFPGPSLSAMNTSLCGNFSNRLAGLPKLVASTSGGLPAIHCDRSIVLVDAGVEPDQDAARLVADVLDRVPVPLRDVADVALLQRLGPVTPVRAEHRHADLPFDDVLPLVGRRVPVQLPQRPGLEVEDRAGDGLGDRKLGGIDHATAGPPC